MKKELAVVDEVLSCVDTFLGQPIKQPTSNADVVRKWQTEMTRREVSLKAVGDLIQMLKKVKFRSTTDGN